MVAQVVEEIVSKSSWIYMPAVACNSMSNHSSDRIGTKPKGGDRPCGMQESQQGFELGQLPAFWVLARHPLETNQYR